jgi:ferric-dicitrate binding protein FerR (iron transport regulator)
MNCPVFEETLAYAERSPISTDLEERVISHLVDCGDCRESFIAVRRVEAALAEPAGSVDEVELPMSIIRRLTGRATRAGTGRRNGRLSVRRAAPPARPIWIGALAGAVAAVVVFLLLAALVSPMPSPRGPSVARTGPGSERGAAAVPVPHDEDEDEPQPVPRRPELAEPPIERIPDVQPPQPHPAAPEEFVPEFGPSEEAPAAPERTPPTRVVPARREFVARVCQVDGRIATDKHSKGLKLGDQIHWEEEIAVPAKGRLGLRLPDGGWVFLKEGARIRFDTLEDGGTQADVLAGDSFFDLPKQEVPFRVLAGPERVLVVGTSFLVSRGDKETRLFVESGSVLFSNALGQVEVKGGYAASARENEWPGRPERADVGAELGWVRALGEVLLQEKFDGRLRLAERWREIQEAKFATGQRLSGLAIKVANPDNEVRAAGLVTKEAYNLDSPIRIRAKFKLEGFPDKMSFNVGFARRSDEGLSGDLWRWSILNGKEVLRIRKSGQNLDWIHWEAGSPSLKPDAWHTVEVTLDSRWIALSINGQRVCRSFLPRPIREEVQAGIWIYLGGAQTIEAVIDEIVIERLR